MNTVGPSPAQWEPGPPQAGHVGGLPVLWIKIECSGPEFFLLKAHLSSKSLTLFLLNEGGGNWTRTVRGRLNEGGDAAAGMCDAAPSWRPQVK